MPGSKSFCFPRIIFPDSGAIARPFIVIILCVHTFAYFTFFIMFVPLFFVFSVLLVCTNAQSTITVNPEHSAIPSPYPNPYYNPHRNTSWLQQHNMTWFNASQPNSPWSNATDSNGNFEAAYYPGRAPAVPLAVRSPYTSAWASTANNGSLNSQWPIFW